MSRGAKYPDTLVPSQSGYYDTLVSRITANLLPTLEPYLSSPTTRHVLELASGNGTHLAVYATHPTCSHVETWSPTEADNVMAKECDDNLSCMLGSQDNERVRNKVTQTQVLDATEEHSWQQLKLPRGANDNESGTWDVVIACNCLHMIPFPSGSEAIFSHLAQLVTPGGVLLACGPFRSDEGYFSESDEAFDKMIRARPQASQLGIGLRSIDALDRLARRHGGWRLEKRSGIAKGNWVLVFRNGEAVNQGAREASDIGQLDARN